MLANEALNYVKKSQEYTETQKISCSTEETDGIDISEREKLVKMQIAYIDRKIRHYANIGFMKCYDTLEYILPEVLNHFYEKGFGLCRDRISWKNATFGEALDCYEIANIAFLKKVAEEIRYIQKCGYETSFRFSSSHIHCTKAIKVLEDLGYHIFTKGKQLTISVKRAKSSVLNVRIPNLPSAIELKQICYDRQKQIIDDLIEASVNEGVNEAVIPIKYDLKEFLSEVMECYLSNGYFVNQDTISWNHATKDEQLDIVLLRSIYSKIKAYLHLQSTAIVLKQHVTTQVIEKLLVDGYDVYSFNDATVISWENANVNVAGKRYFSSERFNIDNVSETLSRSILLQLEEELRIF